MPCALHRIFCLFHASERQPADQRLLVGIRNFIEEFLQLLGMDFFSRLLDMIAEISDKGRKFLYFIFIRLFVGPIYKGRLQPEKVLRHGLVGNQHKILNHSGRHVALVRSDLQRTSFFIQNNLTLREIKVYGAALMPLLSEKRRQFLHLLEHGDKGRVLFSLLLVPVLQNLFDGSVGHPAVHPDHGFRNLIVCHFPFFIYCHQTAQCQPVHSLVQGTDPVGKFVGQHGNHPVHEINACAALQSLPVQSRIFLHIVGYIRDMHTQMKQPCLILIKADRIVQILGILPIYGHHL